MTLFRCSLWLTYGKLTNQNSVILVNTIGSALFFFYNVVYYVFTVNKSSVLKQFFIASLALFGSITYTQYETNVEASVQTIGNFICQLFTQLDEKNVLFCIRHTVLRSYSCIFCGSFNYAFPCY